MEGFEEAVAEIKILKESLCDMHDEIISQEEKNKGQLIKLANDLKENKLKMLNEAAKEAGKVLITEEQLRELESEVKKWKEECVRIREKIKEEIKEKVQAHV